MIYTGHVKGGVVVFEAEPPPEGAPVRVEVCAGPPAQETAGGPSIWSKLSKYSGAVDDLPADFARNHDHYIHGAEKK